MSTNTPDQIIIIAEGITECIINGQGGILLSDERNALVPDYMRRDDKWYEETVDWSIVACVFASEHKKYFNTLHLYVNMMEVAKATLLKYHTDSYERFHNVKLTEKENAKIQEILFVNVS